MNTLLRKSILTATGLIFTSGAFAGPAALADQALGKDTTPTTAAVQTVDQTKDSKPNTDSKPTKGDKPSTGKLMPHGTQGKQSTIPLNKDQTDNAKAIIKATKNNGMDERAAVVAIGTSLQETKLENLGHLGAANDHDSQGLFQQRPSSGWGTVEQITDPEYSTTAFLKGLKQVDGWNDMPLTKAAQTVQVSAYPDAYAQWETQAADIVAQHWNS